MRKEIVLITLLLIIFPLRAEYFHHIGMENGLSQLFVRSIHQDILGRMWFCTSHGIDIFDGHEVKTLEPLKQLFRDSTSVFDGNSTGRLHRDREGHMFFIADNRLVKYDIYKDEVKLCSPARITALNTHDGIVYVWQDNVLSFWDNTHDQLIRMREITGRKVNYFVMEDSGKMWLGCDDGLYTLDADHPEPELVVNIRTITCMTKRSNGEIWVGSYIRGLFRITANGNVIHYNKENSMPLGFEEDQIRAIHEDHTGTIWFGTFNGLYKYDDKKNIFSCFKRDFRQGGLSNSSVHSLFLDKHGTLWVGTYFGGVNYFNPDANRMHYYTDNPDQDDCLTHPVVGEMVEDKNGNIWICTEGGGLNCLDVKTGKIRHFQSNKFPFYLPDTNLKSIVYDEEDHMLYIAAYPVGVFSYDIAKDKFDHIISEETAKHTEYSPHPMIYKLSIYRDELFIASDDGMYKMVLKSREITPILSNTYTASFVIDKTDHLWTVERRQIRKISLQNYEDKKVYILDHPQETLSLTSLYVDDLNTLYAGTFGSGIFTLDRETDAFSPFYSGESSLQSSFSYKIGESRNGDLLVMSDKGLTILDKKGTVVRTYPSNVPPLSSFVNDCGLLVTSSGRVYVGGTKGLTSLEIDNSSEQMMSNLFFAELFLQNERITPSGKEKIIDRSLPFVEKLTLRHKQNNFRLTFASDLFENISQPYMYEYRLAGFDREWITASSTSIPYTNLSPGNYNLILRVKPEYQSSYLQINEASLAIQVLKPWFGTWWAWLIWIFLFVIISYGIIHFILTRQRLNRSLELERLEKKHIHEANEARFRFFTNISHEFRTPLTLIISQIELLLQNINLSPMVYNKLLKVSNQSQRMNQLINELLDFRKYEQNRASLKISPCQINYFVTEIGNSFQDYALKRNINFTVHTPDEELTLWIDREEIQKVFTNLLSNAFKFTQDKGTVELTVTDPGSDYINILVSDTGQGIDPEEIKNIFDRFFQSKQNSASSGSTGIGLALTKSIVDMHHGEIQVTSQPGYGSIFKLSLRKGYAHFEKSSGIIFVDNHEPSVCCNTTFLSDEPETVPYEEEYKSDPDETRCKALLVEDNTELLKTLVSLFCPLYDVETAINGKEGLEKALHFKPDIIISDVMMPVMSGTEMCQAIKRNIELSHIPVVLLTALNLPEHNMSGLRTGADDYIIKPFNSKLLLARCNNLIRSRKLLMQKFASKQEMEVEMLATTPVDKEFLDKVVKIIDAHITDINFGVNELATELTMSRSGLFLKFKSLTGMTPNDFIRGQRLKHAAELLKSNREITISEVADRFTFCTPGYFGRCFKEQFGVTPQEYRKQTSDN